MSLPNSLKLHQLLHGYDGGHRLLAGSRDLPPAAARRIMTQSDLSGTIPPRGFESYLTSYPVPEIASYAFARTWYAPEMSRPGCVWTHTLLIEISDLGRIDDLRMIGHLFQRPLAGKIGESYQQPHTLSFEDTIACSAPDLDIAKEFIRAFYGSGASPVVLPDTTSSALEDLLFEAWAQLWPTARATLTISSGSLSPRRFDGRPFDLQIAPPSVAREVVRSANAILVDDKSSMMSIGDESWVAAVQSDFVTHGRSGFRKFLARVGDASIRKSDVPGLAKIYAQIGQRTEWSRNDLTDLFQLIAENFPDPDTATALKAFSLTLGDHVDDVSFHRWAVHELASEDFGSAFSAPALGLEQKVQSMLAEHPTEAMSLLVGLLQRSLNPFGEQVTRGLISGFQDSQAIAFLRSRPQFVSTIVRLRPSLAANPQLWESLRYQSHDILEAIAESAENNPEMLRSIFSVLFEVGLDYQASHFVELFTTAAVGAIFSHRGPLPENLHDRWLDALATRPALVMQYLGECEEVTREIVSGVSATLSPEYAATHSFPLARWIDALREWEPTFSPHQRAVAEVCSFSFALSLRRRDAESVELAILSFETVHAAGLVQGISHVGWSNLEPLLPRISFPRDWDRCERLRRALLAMYSENIWPIETLGRMVRNQATFESVMRTASEISDGGRAVEMIASSVPLLDPQSALAREVARNLRNGKKKTTRNKAQKRT